MRHYDYTAAVAGHLFTTWTFACSVYCTPEGGRESVNMFRKWRLVVVLVLSQMGCQTHDFAFGFFQSAEDDDHVERSERHLERCSFV